MYYGCLKRVSEIGVLIEVPFVVPSFILLPWWLFTIECGVFFIRLGFWYCFSLPHLPPSPHFISSMSSPSSSYVQVGLDNLECPLNRSPSPRAQVRGFDWSSLIVD